MLGDLEAFWIIMSLYRPGDSPTRKRSGSLLASAQVFKVGVVRRATADALDDPAKRRRDESETPRATRPLLATRRGPRCRSSVRPSRILIDA
jgi:hypothetical protein